MAIMPKIEGTITAQNECLYIDLGIDMVWHG